MNTEILFHTITSSPKWYIGVPAPRAKKGKLTVHAACQIKRRFKEGALSDERIEEIFNHFGYTKSEITWKHKTDQ